MRLDPATRRPVLVAHRGDSLSHPENTLAAVAAALAAPADWVEIDVQVTADGVPVVLHDATLARTTGVDGCIMEMDLAAVRAIEVDPCKRVPTLAEAVKLLGERSQTQLFVEIKLESMERFGVERVVGLVLEAIEPLGDR